MRRDSCEFDFMCASAIFFKISIYQLQKDGVHRPNIFVIWLKLWNFEGKIEKSCLTFFNVVNVSQVGFLEKFLKHTQKMQINL